MPVVPSIASLALLAVVLGAATATVSSMIFGLLATELPPDRRSAALNLVYLPLYAAGIIGPAAGALVVSVAGVGGLFAVAGAIFLVGAATILSRVGPATGSEEVGPVDRPPTPVQF
jgi:MFS family permease